MNIPNPLSRPPETDLANWRVSPHSRWAFQHIRELIPTAPIAGPEKAQALPKDIESLPEQLPLDEDTQINLTELLVDSETDSMLILHQGKIKHVWSAPHTDIRQPHILFSISKSITAMLTGILVKQGMIRVEDRASHYLPGCRGSAYEDATIQHLLDMSVALNFTEDYLQPDGDYVRYRNATGWNPIDQTTNGMTLEPFLYGLGKADFGHGEMFNYKSPNTDLLGLILERTAGLPYSKLVSTLLWQPMKAKQDAYVTLDRALVARSAGGICATLEDLARFGQMVLDRGAVGTKQVIPESWVMDTRHQGDVSAWQRGNFKPLLPDGCYRNQWYQMRDEDQCFLGLGIHGQWLFINPVTQVVIVRLSSQTLPLNEPLDFQMMPAFKALSRHWD